MSNNSGKFLTRSIQWSKLRCISAQSKQIHSEAKKKEPLLLWINLLIRNVMWRNLVLLLLLNIIIDVTYLISGIYLISAGYCAKSAI